MIKDIKYGGYSAQPSDYEVPDGHLAASLNIISEDGAVKPLLNPAEELFVSNGHQILLLHSVAGQVNIVILTGDRNSEFGLSWIKRSPELINTNDAVAIRLKSPLKQFRSISIAGNTLAVATSEGVFYILWKDDDYNFLGNRPPFLPISFGAYKVGELSQTSSKTYSDVPRGTYTRYFDNSSGAGQSHAPWTSDDDAFWMRVSEQALSLLLSNVSAKITSKGYFYQPFYIRYAFKLYDGSYSWHSAPILMLVTTHSPVISLPWTASGSTVSITCKLEVPYFAISYRLFGALETLKEWSDIVSGIDIFISSPIYTYNQDKSGRPLSKVGVYTGLGNSGSSDSKVLIGHYATSIDGDYVDHFINTSASDMSNLVCALSNNETFNDKIQNEFLFYKISSFSLDELAETGKMKRLPLLKSDLANINTLEHLPDEYNSHATILPSALHTYNQRLLMGDISIMPPKPFPMSSMAQTTTKSSSSGPIRPESIRVFSRVNGKKCVSEISLGAPPKPSDPTVYPFDVSFPRFIYHPDASAYKMEITSSDGKFYSLPLKQHPHLNGAYWFGGLGVEPADIKDDKDNTTAKSALVPNKVYVSEINNPFVFPAEKIVTIGCGHIYELCSAAKALSQGQFGQFPLYAFTDEGVWALEVSATGSFSARQPITRDVILKGTTPLQMDSAVLFATDRGIMLISGSQTQCISDGINSPKPFDVLQLPRMADLHAMLGHGDDSCLPTAPFLDFISGCGMLYDYVHQRVIVYNPAYTYAYIFSLKSREWGMMYSTIASHLNSYPEALAVDRSGAVLNFSSMDGVPQKGLLVTRPLKLDGPDILKTVDTIIQRGNFRRGHVASVLYGSRDLVNWHLVWTSRDHYLRGFRGSPYKYFRIALLCDLDSDESIYGASVQFTPRQTNQLR